MAVFSHVAHARVVVQHIGANDPLTEGFVLDHLVGGAEIGPVFDDLGRDAWMIKSNSPQEAVEYQAFFTDQDREDAIAHGWELSATVRFIDVSESQNAQSLGFDTGSEAFWLTFFTDLNGVLRVSDRRGTSYSLEDSDGGYHSFKLEYDTLTAAASLWVDGAESGLEFLSDVSTNQRMLRLSTGEGPDHAHWNEVTFRIIPEPMTVALLTGLSALFFVGIVRWRKRKAAGLAGFL